MQKGEAQVTYLSVILCILYVVCGIFTMKFMKNKVSRITYLLYFALFLILFAYIPYITGSRLMSRFLSLFLHENAIEVVRDQLMAPLAIATPYFTYSFVIAIFISIFLCISIAYVAMAIIRYIYKKCSEDFRPDAGSRKIKSFYREKSMLFPRAARYVFCRYNC